MEETKARMEELQILVNLLDGELRLNYPPYHEFDLLRAKPADGEYRVKILQDKKDFRREKERFGKYSKEVPSYNDFKECLLSSGIISCKNIEEFEKYINQKKYNTTKKILFSPDTNLFYQNFFSNFGKIKPEEIAPVTTVKEEISAKMESDYGHLDLKKIKESSDCQKIILNELAHGGKKESRKASYLADREYKKFADREIPAVEDSTYDSAENDRIIIKSVQKFEKDNQLQPIFLSADKNLIKRSDLEKIEHYHIKTPDELDLDSCTHQEFIKLVSDLASFFGLVKLNSVIIYGEFKGKDPDEKNHFKLKFLNEDICPDFKKHQKICRDLSNLEIDK